MPNNLEKALTFLETQWWSINQNKAKGVMAEVRFIQFLNTPEVVHLYKYVIPGGWIISPGNYSRAAIPTMHRIAIIPNNTPFSWSGVISGHAFTAQVAADIYFGQAGIPVYFAYPATEINKENETKFRIPFKNLNGVGEYPLDYDLRFMKVEASGLVDEVINEVMQAFPTRKGNLGMRINQINRLNRQQIPWNDARIVTELFWKEYCRYYLQKQYLVSNNDIDFFLVSKSKKSYPVELKSKTCAKDKLLGSWFGIDIGPFSKLSYFVSLSSNMDALYVVEEVDDNGNHIEWWGIKFSNLLKGCSWVSQTGGIGGLGGASSTIKVPKALMSKLEDLLINL